MNRRQADERVNNLVDDEDELPPPSATGSPIRFGGRLNQKKVDPRSHIVKRMIIQN